VAGHRGPRTVSPVKFEKMPIRALAAVATVLLVLATGLALSSGGVVRVSPGPAESAASALRVGQPTAGNPDATGSPLITTVRAEELSKWEALWCGVKPSCDTLVLADPLGSKAPSTQMDGSVQSASAAADALLGSRVMFPDAPGTEVTVPGIGGPSAGLTLSLHFVNLRSTGNLFSGYTVAATGTVSDDGKVGPVGGVEHKAQGAARAGAQVLFVPAAEVGQVGKASTLQVVGVSSLREAVTWLCDRGASSSACD
jgi:PDZ domain-containing protein